MRRFFGIKEGEQIVIEGEEFNHLKNVLRLGVGEEVIVFLNDEFEYACQIEKMTKGKAYCKFLGKQRCEGNPTKNIVLFQAITKKEKFEFIVQKATELGVSKIVPFTTKYIVAKPTENKIERLKTIAENACKQCERTIVPSIESAKSFAEVVAMFKEFDIVLFANERAEKGEKPKEIVKAKNIAIIVGSEGGFAQEEKEAFEEAGVTTVTLGKRILRAETASVAMMSLVSVLSGN